MRPEDLLPIKTFAELMEATTARLKTLAFRITNLRPGGVFYTLLEMGHQALADLYALFKEVVPQFYLDTATGDWLELKAAEYAVYRKPALKTRGNVIFTRESSDGNLIIPAGTEVATKVDYNGNRLKFIVTEQAVIADGFFEGPVPVEAEFAGVEYNIGAGMITELLTHINGIVQVRNEEGWITREGTDEENDESLRARAKNAWYNLSVSGTRAAYENWAKEINGVVAVWVNDQHPRGQGTVDVVITSTAGIPSADLIQQVQSHIDSKRPVCTDVLVMGPQAITVDFDVILQLSYAYGDTSEIANRAAEIIDIMFRYGDTAYPEIRKISPQIGLVKNQVIANLLTIKDAFNVVLNAPAADVPATGYQLPVKGAVNITVEILS